MIDPISKNEQTARFFRMATLITLSMMMAVLLYGGLGYYLIQQGKYQRLHLGMAQYRMIQAVILLVSVVAITGARLLTESLVRKCGAAGTLSARVLYTNSIVLGGASELPAVLGLFLLFLYGDFYGFIPFAVLALLALVFHFPNKKKWQQQLGTSF